MQQATITTFTAIYSRMTAAQLAALQLRVLAGLRAEGWRIKVDHYDQWRVLPPEDYYG